MFHQTLETAQSFPSLAAFSHAGKAAVSTDCYRRRAPLPCVYWYAHLPSRELISGHWKGGFSVDLHRLVILPQDFTSLFIPAPSLTHLSDCNPASVFNWQHGIFHCRRFTDVVWFTSNSNYCVSVDGGEDQETERRTERERKREKQIKN